MIADIFLPRLNGAETTEFARMLLARKLVPESRIGTLSPTVNAALAQCVILESAIPLSLAGWLPRLKAQFIQEMSDPRADPSLNRFLHELNDDADRRSIIGQYFLPFHAAEGIDLSSAQAIADAFTAQIRRPWPALDMGVLYPSSPEDGSIALPRPFAGFIYDQMLIGRHSPLHLEARRGGETDDAASDAVIHAFMEALAGPEANGLTPQPFHTRQLRHEDFAQSLAHAQMRELGFSRKEMLAALSPWKLVD